ncbi:MAG TPA: hypothetical protein VGG28_21785 [Kofleriaceae bacterium]|jgi:hypothetical protein
MSAQHVREVSRISTCASVDVRERTDENASMVIDIAWAKLVPPDPATAAAWKQRESRELHRYYDGVCDGHATTERCTRQANGPTCITVVPPGATMLDAAHDAR